LEVIRVIRVIRGWFGLWLVLVFLILFLAAKSRKRRKKKEFFYPQITQIYTDKGTSADWHLCSSVASVDKFCLDSVVSWLVWGLFLVLSGVFFLTE